MKIGMGQVLVEGGEADANMDRAAAMIGEAAKAGCSVVVLPECLDAGWTWPDARRLACPIPGPRSDVLAAEARRHSIHVVAGLTERDGDRVYNAAILVSAEGELLLKHRKINELDIGRPFYDTGDRLGVARTPIGVIGITLCADNSPDSLVFAESIARMGAGLVLSPCAWAVDADHDNVKQPYGGLWLDAYGQLTRRHPITVIGVSSVGWLTGGPWKGRKCIGNSIAMGPGGRVRAGGQRQGRQRVRQEVCPQVNER
jgi:predicted amidohydrolase